MQISASVSVFSIGRLDTQQQQYPDQPWGEKASAAGPRITTIPAAVATLFIGQLHKGWGGQRQSRLPPEKTSSAWLLSASSAVDALLVGINMKPKDPQALCSLPQVQFVPLLQMIFPSHSIWTLNQLDELCAPAHRSMHVSGPFFLRTESTVQCTA